MSQSSNKMNEIMPGLFLGNVQSAFDVKQLNQNTIKTILAIMKTKPEFNVPNVKHHFIEIMETPDEDMLIIIEQANEIISDSLNQKQNILIYCQSGTLHSAIIVIAYVMKIKNLPFFEALKEVKNKSNILDPGTDFVNQLNLWENAKYKLDLGERAIKNYLLARWQKAFLNFKDEFNKWSDYWRLYFGYCKVKSTYPKYICKNCKEELFENEDVISVSQNESHEITTLYIFPVPWICFKWKGENYQGIISCPKCNIQLGAFNWFRTDSKEKNVVSKDSHISLEPPLIFSIEFNKLNKIYKQNVINIFVKEKLCTILKNFKKDKNELKNPTDRQTLEDTSFEYDSTPRSMESITIGKESEQESDEIKSVSLEYDIKQISMDSLAIGKESERESDETENISLEYNVKQESVAIGKESERESEVENISLEYSMKQESEVIGKESERESDEAENIPLKQQPIKRVAMRMNTSVQIQAIPQVEQRDRGYLRYIPFVIDDSERGSDGRMTFGRKISLKYDAEKEWVEPTQFGDESERESDGTLYMIEDIPFECDLEQVAIGDESEESDGTMNIGENISLEYDLQRKSDEQSTIGVESEGELEKTMDIRKNASLELELELERELAEKLEIKSESEQESNERMDIGKNISLKYYVERESFEQVAIADESERETDGTLDMVDDISLEYELERELSKAMSIGKNSSAQIQTEQQRDGRVFGNLSVRDESERESNGTVDVGSNASLKYDVKRELTERMSIGENNSAQIQTEEKDKKIGNVPVRDESERESNGTVNIGKNISWKDDVERESVEQVAVRDESEQETDGTLDMVEDISLEYELERELIEQLSFENESEGEYDETMDIGENISLQYDLEQVLAEQMAIGFERESDESDRESLESISVGEKESIKSE